ncbi:hypothetical protein [Hymenobacter bucti]|uniref:Uncharacterized protein n=1 Tax=Hymenobacter bucti TaxID=1844114 RepID=A0ABW4QY74_9BACT
MNYLLGAATLLLPFATLGQATPTPPKPADGMPPARPRRPRCG